MNLKNRVSALGLVAALLATTGPALAESITLKLANYSAPGNGMNKDFMLPWAKQLEECSGGQVKVETHLGGSQLGNPARLYDAVKAGVVDIAQGLSGIPAGQFPRTRILELPFMVSSAQAATNTLMDLYDPYLKDDFEGVRILALHASNANPIHLREKYEVGPDDLDGLRLRFPSGTVKDMMDRLGAVPVGMPPTELYQSLERGVIDGAAIGWDTLHSRRLAEVTTQSIDAELYSITFWFAMNQRSYDRLPDDVKACIDDQSGPELASKFGDWWDIWDQEGIDLAKGMGHEISTLTPELRESWETKLAPVTDSYLSELESQGIDNAREIYNQMKLAIAKYE
jgi:TRAP-type C4-dicarboxylate transport system substrate-binding protein